MLVLLPFAYLLGTFPSAVWVARANGVDILAVGSGNPGASNVSRTLGKKWGVLVFLLDALKGVIPALVGLLVLDSRPAAYALISAAILGHMFPVTRRFRGGKGVATMAGAMLPMFPVLWAVLAVLWLVVMKLTHKSSLGTLALGAGFVIGLLVSGAPLWEFVTLLGLVALVLVRHVDNFKRLRSGRELSSVRD